MYEWKFLLLNSDSVAEMNSINNLTFMNKDDSICELNLCMKYQSRVQSERLSSESGIESKIDNLCFQHQLLTIVLNNTTISFVK